MIKYPRLCEIDNSRHIAPMEHKIGGEPFGIIAPGGTDDRRRVGGGRALHVPARIVDHRGKPLGQSLGLAGVRGVRCGERNGEDEGSHRCLPNVIRWITSWPLG